MFNLRLLGGALIEGPDGPLSGRIAQRRQLALLAFLSLQGDRPVSRDKLQALFWPEADTESARHSLADGLYLIRKALGEESVRAVGEGLFLEPERVASDVRAFEATLARGDLEAAVEAYGGPLLDGFHLTGSRPFEDWVTLERARLARAHLGALERLADQCEAAGDARAAVEWWGRAAAVEPHNGRIVLRLMRALAESGDRVGAIRLAAVHSALLAEEYGAEPDAEILALAEELREGGGGESSGSSPPAAATASAPLPSTAETASEPDRPGARVRDPRSFRRRLPRLAGWALVGALVFVAARTILGLAGADAEAAAEAGAAAAERLDPALAVIVPFRTAGADSALAYLHEGMVDLLSAKLTGEGGLAALDPGPLLGRWRERTDGVSELGREAALELAREFGAGTLITGAVVGTAENLSLQANLIDVASGQARGAGAVYGGEASLHDLVDGLVAELLARRAGEAEHRLAHLTSTSLPALRVFLEGRSAHRRGDYEGAVRRYARALDLDSTFALAGLGLNQVSGWVGGTDPVLLRGVVAANRYAERLSERDRVGLLGRVAPRAGERWPSVSEQLEAAEAALRRWPDHPMLWYRRGDLLLHHGQAMGISGWAERSRESFERALDLDPDYSENVHHLAVILAVMGDSAALRSHVARHLARYPGGPIADHLRWRAWHVFGESAGFSAPELDSMDTDATLRWIGLEAQDYGFALADGARAVRLRAARPGIRDERFERLLGTHAYALNGGRPIEARAILESLADVQPDPHYHLHLALLAALYADGDQEAAARAARGLASAVAHREEGMSLDACVLAQWDLHLQVAARVPGSAVRAPGSAVRTPGSAVHAASPEAPDVHDPHQPSRLAVCTAVLEAQRAEAAAGPSSAPARLARERLDGLMAAARHTGLVDDGQVEYAHLALARLHEAAGDSAAALEALRRRTYYLGWQPYLAAKLSEEGRLAGALGDTAGAVRAWEHYLAFRTDPESVLREEVERVRSGLAALRAPLAARSDPVEPPRSDPGTR